MGVYPTHCHVDATGFHCTVESQPCLHCGNPTIFFCDVCQRPVCHACVTWVGQGYYEPRCRAHDAIEPSSLT